MTKLLPIERRLDGGPFRPDFLVADAVANATSLQEMSRLLIEFGERLATLHEDGWRIDDHRGEGDGLFLVDEGGFGTREGWRLELDRCSAMLREQRLGRERERYEFIEEARDKNPMVERVSDMLAAHDGVEWDPVRNAGLDCAALAATSQRFAWWRGTACGHEYEWPVERQREALSHWGSFRSPKERRRVCRVCDGQTETAQERERRRRKEFKTARLDTFWPEAASWWNFERNPTHPEEHLASDPATVWWVHPKCKHPFQRSIRSFSPPWMGCAVCENKQVLAGHNDLLTRHPVLAGIVTEEANPGRRLDELPSWGATPVGWACPDCGARCEHPAKRLTQTPLPTCGVCAPVGTSAIEIALRDALGERFNVQPGEATLQVPWGNQKVCRVDIAGSTPAGQPFVVEYDGSHWHKNKVAKDQVKTRALLSAGYLVVRVRENDLPDLAIETDGLIQIGHRYGAPLDRLLDQIEVWLNSRATGGRGLTRESAPTYPRGWCVLTIPGLAAGLSSKDHSPS